MNRAAIMRWLRHCYWQAEDKLVDILDWAPPPTPQMKPLPAPPPKEQRQVPFHFTSVGFQRATPEQADAEMLRQVLQAIGKNTFVEIRW